jgi:hypothetical protein
MPSAIREIELTLLLLLLLLLMFQQVMLPATIASPSPRPAWNYTHCLTQPRTTGAQQQHPCSSTRSSGAHHAANPLQGYVPTPGSPCIKLPGHQRAAPPLNPQSTQQLQQQLQV